MTPIYKGVDCSKRGTRQKLGLRLKDREIQAQPEELIYLSLLDVHRDCDPYCYQWKLRVGGGILHYPVGKTVIYSAPSGNKECENNALIDVFTGSKLLDTAYITVSPYAFSLCKPGDPYVGTVPPVAYAVTGHVMWGAEHTGSTYTKPDGTKALAQEYLAAWYETTYYDCSGSVCWIRQMPKLHWWGYNAPTMMLEKMYGSERGRLRDYRTAEMKKMECCPPKVWRDKFKEP